LFGAPGVNLRVRASVQLSAKEYTNKKWKGYHFSDPTREFSGQNLKVPDGSTDAAGLFDVQLPVPISMLPPSMLQAEIYAEVLDNGGRPVGANAVLDVHRYPYYLGLKCEEGKEAAPGKKVHLKYVAITPDGEPTTVKQQVFLIKRKVWYSIFRRSGWSGRGFESSYYEQVVDGQQIDVDGKGSYTFTPDKPGEYTIYLGNEESMRSSIQVSVTGPEEQNTGEEAPTDLQEPGKLSLVLNQIQYAMGEIPKVEVRAPFAGRLVLSVEREQVFYSTTVPVVAGLNVVSLPPVTANYLPNAYVVGLLVRKPDEALRRLPMASFGVTPLLLDTSSHEINFKWDAPEAVKSHDGLDVNLDTGVPGSKVVLAAVDEGILQIIAFTTPDPFKYFYRKRGLTTSTLSLFADVLPDLNRKDSVGGDEGEGFGFRHLNPIAAKRVKSFALYSGILTADKTGKVTYHFPTDKFQGEVRVMALGVEDNKFGASAFHVKVADPVVVEPSFPRFLAPGDRFDVPVLIYNNTKEKQTLSVALDAKGPVAVDGEASQTLTLSGEGQKQILFHAKAKVDAGVAHFKVTATDEGGSSYDVDTELAVRPGNPLSTEIKYGPLSAGGNETLQVPGGFIPQGQRIRLAVSSNPMLTYLGCMDYLIHYPYGCAEQKTSQAFPLLYFKDIGLLTGRFPDRANAVEEYVQGAINDVCKQQLSDGSFALWPGQQESGGDWLFYYVSNFLIEAQQKGYDVSPSVLDKIYNKLGAIQVTGKGVGRLDRRQQNVEIPDSAYVLYLKALAGRADVESMAAFKADLKDKSPEQKCFLSLAYSTMGDRATALSVLPPKYLPSKLQRELNGEWFSPNREMALYLLAMTEADPQNAEIPNLLIEFGKNLQGLGRGYFGTTEEDAWCFMAVGKAVKATTTAYPLSATWSLKGGEAHVLTGETAIVKAQDLSGKTVELKNTGNGQIFYHLMGEGTKLESKKESVENGIKITREYRDEKGNTVNLGSVSQGELVVVTLRMKASKDMDNVVIVDLLPAGFEVENPRLSSRGSLRFEPDCSFSPAAMDFRDDRVLLFSGAWEGEQAFSYSVRAVTPGQFQVPGVTAEAMYDPDIFGRTNTGETLIVAPNKY
ncbi:MAG TPA: alpha-2-macroglobulin family protein, partial [bacterium]|nr:alpha-2-macroglobulin family protein [bacterium]